MHTMWGLYEVTYVKYLALYLRKSVGSAIIFFVGLCYMCFLTLPYHAFVFCAREDVSIARNLFKYCTYCIDGLTLTFCF